MIRSKSIKKRWGSWGKKAVCTAAAGAMAFCMLPATAFASVGEDGTVYYKLPAADAALSFQHELTDADGNTYTQEYLSYHCSGNYAESSYYLLGINAATGTKDLSSSMKVTDGSVTLAKIGLYGTSANQNPDEYLWNYCVRLNGGSVPADSYTSSGNVTVEINGTEYANMPRPIYMECNMISYESTASTAGYTYAQWVELENQRSDRPKSGTYNPTFATWSTLSGGFAKLCSSLYNIASISDEMIEESKDKNGNYGYATRYAEGPETYKVVQNYEDITKATQYYLQSKFKDGSLKKATAAVIVGYDPNTKNYACRILNTDAMSNGSYVDPDTNKYGGRLSNSVASICNDICDLDLTEAQPVYDEAAESDFVKWYTPEQIIGNCDAVLISDGTGGYCAKDSTGKTNSVYSRLASEEANENIQGLINAQVSAIAAGKSYADIAWKWPEHVFNCYYAQGCENVLLGIVSSCFLYPEVYDITDTMAWWAKNVWHVTDASLQDIVDSTCNGISMSRNQVQLGTISANYEADIQALIDEGNLYYIANSDEIDALNHGNLKTYDMDTLKARYYSNISDQLDTAKAEVAQLEGELDAANAKAEGLQKDLDSANASATAANQKAADVQTQLDAANRTVSDLQAQLAEIEGKTVAQKVYVAAASKTFKAADLKKKAASFNIGADAMTTISYAVTAKASAKIAVSKAGKVTMKKGAKKGTYKVTVSAAEENGYAAASKVVTIKVK